MSLVEDKDGSLSSSFGATCATPGHPSVVINLSDLRPPGVHGSLGVSALAASHYLDMSGVQSVGRRANEEVVEVPQVSRLGERGSVWIERVRQRRPMNQLELLENANLFSSIDRDRKLHYLSMVCLSTFWIVLFGLILSMVHAGIIPFCSC